MRISWLHTCCFLTILAHATLVLASSHESATNDTETTDVVFERTKILYTLDVSRHCNAPLNHKEADQILAEASEILTKYDGSGDEKCPVELRRGHGINVFVVGAGDIFSESDYEKIYSFPGHIKVVNSINWCGTVGPNILGCATTPGASFVVVRHFQSEAILWAHEFLHNKGVLHRSGDFLVMNDYLTKHGRRVNAAECNTISPIIGIFGPNSLT